MSLLRKPQWLSNRKFWFSPELDDPTANPNYADDNRYSVNNYEDANLVSSNVNDGGFNLNYHLPVLDIDYPAHLEPSTTEGHYHLYLNKRITWTQYCKIMDAMYEAGLLEAGFVKLSKKRGATFVRKPGHRKAGK